MPPTSTPANAPPRWALEDFGVGSGDAQMEKTEQEIRCSICDKRVTLQEDICTDENGKPVHTDCYAKRILQGDGQLLDPAA